MHTRILTDAYAFTESHICIYMRINWFRYALYLFSKWAYKYLIYENEFLVSINRIMTKHNVTGHVSNFNFLISFTDEPELGRFQFDTRSENVRCTCDTDCHGDLELTNFLKVVRWTVLGSARILWWYPGNTEQIRIARDDAEGCEQRWPCYVAPTSCRRQWKILDSNVWYGFEVLVLIRFS